MVEALLYTHVCLISTEHLDTLWLSFQYGDGLVSPPYLAIELPFTAPIYKGADSTELADPLRTCLLSRWVLPFVALSVTKRSSPAQRIHVWI